MIELRKNENGSKVVDVGQGWSRDNLGVDCCKKRMGVIMPERQMGIDSAFGRDLQHIRVAKGARDFGGTVHAIGVAGQGVNTFGTVERERKREAKLGIRTAHTIASAGDRQFSARQEKDRRIARFYPGM